ncbi:MAG: hypothetical protein LWW85_12980 [Marinilabiliales bacterium]|nr:hypothetical protein [Marinilabiliales bacterium]
MKRSVFAISLFLAVFQLISCHRNPLKKELSGIACNLTVHRLDQALGTIQATNIEEKIPLMRKDFGSYFEWYNTEILAIGNSRDSLYRSYLLTFLKDPLYTVAKARSDSIFGNFDPYKKELEQAFRYCRSYYPNRTLPEIFTYLSGYNRAISTLPDAIGISLDNYLGAGFPEYRKLQGLYEYKRRNMEPRKLLYDALNGWIEREFEYKGQTENLVSTMIYKGKLLYFLDALVPDGPDSLKIGYRKKDLDWCQVHEGDMWKFLIEKRLLFSGDRMEVVHFIQPAPFTAPFGQQSPGRAGVWMGWQIVRSYVRKHPETTLQQLMAENDYHKLLNESGYSPD